MRNSSPNLGRLFLILAVTGCLTTFGTAVLTFYQIGRTGKGTGWFSNNKGGLLNTIKEGVRDAVCPTQLKSFEAVNILVAGVDQRAGDVGRTDSIHMLRIYNNSGYAGIFSIPRDSYVFIGDTKHQDKINSAYALGGTDRLVRTVENFLGVPMDDHIVVNLNAFIKVVDDFGGIDLDVEKRMKYNDRRGNLHIDLQPGQQHLNGVQAMGYVRFRHDRTGDFGRIFRQQKFAQEFVKQKVGITNMGRLEDTFDQLSASKDIQTDLTVCDVMYLKSFFKPEDIDNRMIPVMIPGEVGTARGGMSIVLPIESYREEVERLVLKQQQPIEFFSDDPLVFQNTCGSEERGNFIKSLLRMNGVRFSKASRGNRQPPTTVVRGDVPAGLASQLRNFFTGRVTFLPAVAGEKPAPPSLELGLDACRKL